MTRPPYPHAWRIVVCHESIDAPAPPPGPTPDTPEAADAAPPLPGHVWRRVLLHTLRRGCRCPRLEPATVACPQPGDAEHNRTTLLARVPHAPGCEALAGADLRYSALVVA